MFRILITEPAESDIRVAHNGWRDHRSGEQAERWYREIYQAIQTLRETPERCPHSPESDLLPSGLRQLSFGIGRRPTHRVVFTVVASDVIVVRVRHASQDALTEEHMG